MDKQAMKRYKVESSNIDSIGHNFLTKNLEIEFKGGNIYRYKKVPRSIFKKMMKADSKGKFFWGNVRFDYPYRKYRTKDGEKVNEDWKRLERKEKGDVERQEKVAMSNVAKSAIAGGVIGATGGAVRGSANTLLNERIPKKKKIKEALKAGAKQALVGGLAGAATGAMTPTIWDLLGGKEKKASEELDTMYKEAALSQAQKTKMLEGLIGAGAGSLVGAGVGALKAKSTSKKKGEDDASSKKRMRRNVLLGTLAGAGIGGAGSIVANKLARKSARKGVSSDPSINDINQSRNAFLDRYEENRRKNYALVDGRTHFDNGGKAVRKAEVEMFSGWSPEDSNVAKANGVRSAANRMHKVKNQLENETGVEFVNRLRDRKFYASAVPNVEGITHKNGKPIVGGHFDNEDYRKYLELSRQRGVSQSEKASIEDRLFGGFRKIDKAKILSDANLAESAAKSSILADVNAIKNQTRKEYLNNKAKNAKKADRMIYHYSNLADKLEGRR